jgi:hypothetical protein
MSSGWCLSPKRMMKVVSASGGGGRRFTERETAGTLPPEVVRLLDESGFTEESTGDAAEQLRALNDRRPQLLDELCHSVPNLDAVLAAAPADMTAVAVAGFLETPHPDLSSGQRPLTPVEWLRRGGDVADVLSLLEIADWSSR